MNKWLGFSGLLGLVLFLFGLIGAFMVQDFGQPILLAHLLLGLLLLVIWFLRAGLQNISQAGQVVLGRKARFGYNLTLYTVVFVGVLIVANWYTSRHDKRWDVTKEGVFSLAGQSEQVLKKLPSPLKLALLTNTGMIDDDKARQLFDLYRYSKPSKVRVEYIDPRSKPHLIDRYEMKQGNLVYIEYGAGEQKGVTRLNETTEEAVTNAIIKLARGVAKKIYFVRGHDEPDIEDEDPQGLKNLQAAIVDENLKIEGIVLAQKAAIPDDASAVILAAPKKPLLPAETDLLIKYVENGGHLLMLTDPRGSAHVREIAGHFGIDVGETVVIDQIQRLFDAPALGAQPVVRDYDRTHAITRGMGQNDITIFNIASSVKTAQHKIDGAKYSELLRSSPTAWGETDLKAIFDSGDPVAVFDEGKDLSGPVSLAVAFENKVSEKAGAEQKTADQGADAAAQEVKFEKTSRVVVFGDSDWVMNANLQVYSNRDLVLNTINWLIGEVGGISIRPRSVTSQVQPVQSEAFVLLLASSFLVPELFLIAGLFIWWRRRSAGA